MFGTLVGQCGDNQIETAGVVAGRAAVPQQSEGRRRPEREGVLSSPLHDGGCFPGAGNRQQAGGGGRRAVRVRVQGHRQGDARASNPRTCMLCLRFLRVQCVLPVIARYLQLHDYL